MIEPQMVIILDDYYCFESMMRIIAAATATAANAIDYLYLMGSWCQLTDVLVY